MFRCCGGFCRGNALHCIAMPRSCEVTLLRRCETGVMSTQLYCTVDVQQVHSSIYSVEVSDCFCSGSTVCTLECTSPVTGDLQSKVHCSVVRCTLSVTSVEPSDSFWIVQWRHRGPQRDSWSVDSDQQLLKLHFTVQHNIYATLLSTAWVYAAFGRWTLAVTQSFPLFERQTAPIPHPYIDKDKFQWYLPFTVQIGTSNWTEFNTSSPGAILPLHCILTNLNAVVVDEMGSRKSTWLQEHAGQC